MAVEAFILTIRTAICWNSSRDLTGRRRSGGQTRTKCRTEKHTAALIPYARNARTHSDQQAAQIAASIREFGFTDPVLIDQEDGIIAGHGQVLAACKLGMTAQPAAPARSPCRGFPTEFAADSPLEEAVRSEPVSEMGFANNARFRGVYNIVTAAYGACFRSYRRGFVKPCGLPTH
jgi:hypothetical protein